VQVECADKAALATRGARPYVAAKGANAVTAIRTIMSYCTGEFRFRLPSSTRRLSKAYSVGWADEAAPFVVASAIAVAELGQQLLYSCDGYLLLHPLPTASSADVGYVTEPANAQVDLTTQSNYVIVTGGTTSKKVGTSTVTTRPQSSAVVPDSSPIAPGRLQRQGVARYLPLVISEDGYKTTTQTAARAKTEVANAAVVLDDLSASVVPMFHLDADDVVTVRSLDNSSRTIRIRTGSIPLGVGGDMTIGFRIWVSQEAAPRVSSHLLRSTKAGAKRHPKKRHRRHAKKH
jgi:hypothetical protein